MPEQLVAVLDVARTSLAEDVEHRLPLLVRRDVHDAMGRKRTKRRYRARTWLAILAAQRVYSVAALALPGRVDLVDRWLAIATDLVEGRMKPDAEPVNKYVRPGYTVLVRPYMEDPDFASRLTVNANCAFGAAELAAFEALGLEGLSDLDSYPAPASDGTELSGEYMVDEQLVWTGTSDAAACAAMAEAWNASENRWDAQRQRLFWEWWILEAVPKAYTLGGRRARTRRGSRG